MWCFSTTFRIRISTNHHHRQRSTFSDRIRAFFPRLSHRVRADHTLGTPALFRESKTGRSEYYTWPHTNQSGNDQCDAGVRTKRPDPGISSPGTGHELSPPKWPIEDTWVCFRISKIGRFSGAFSPNSRKCSPVYRNRSVVAGKERQLNGWLV